MSCVLQAGYTATMYVDDVGAQERIRRAEMEYLRFSLIFSTIFSVPVFFLAKIGPHIECTYRLWSCVMRCVVRACACVSCALYSPAFVCVCVRARARVCVCVCVGGCHWQLCLRCMPAICTSSACS